MFSQVLIRGDYWLLMSLGLATCLASRHVAGALSVCFKGIRMRHLAGLAVLVVAAAALRLQPTHWQHNAFDDEYTHLRLANEMGTRLQYALPDVSPTGSLQSVLPPFPPGFHFFLGLVFQIVGYSERAAFLTNALLGVLCVPAAFFLAWALFQEEWSSFATGAFLAVWPLQIKLSWGTSLEIAGQLSLLLSGICLVLLKRRPSLATLQLAMFASTWTALMRAELLLVVPLALAIAAWEVSAGRVRASPVRLLAAFIPLALPAMHFCAAAVHYNGQRAAVEASTWTEALAFWVRAGLYCPLWTAGALAGAVLLHRQGRRKLAALLLSAWVADILVVSVYRRVDPNLGDLQRYFVIGGTFPLLLSGFAVGRSRAIAKTLASALLLGVLACEAALLPRAAPPISALAANRIEQEKWFKAQAVLIPPEAILISESPAFIWATTGRDPLPVRSAFNPEGDRILASGKPLVWLRESAAPHEAGPMRYRNTNASPGKPGADAMLAAFDLTTLAEETLRGRKVGMYRIVRRKNTDSLPGSGEHP